MMMGYNEAGQDLTLANTFEGRRKLRPLVPRPFLASSGKVNTTCTSLHGHEIFSLHHNHFGEQGGNNIINTNKEDQQQVVVSSRWNPTPEQLRALEELYRCGTRTPSAEQIQHITAQLRRYGKIEGKNVFYWFQNHKARERQKRRRQLQLASETTTHFGDPDRIHIPNNNDNGSGANRVSLELEQNKNMSWAPSTTCGILAQESESETPIKGSEKASAVVLVSAEAASVSHTIPPPTTTNNSNHNGWIQQYDAIESHHHHHNNNNNNNNNSYNPRQNHQLSSACERTATWQLLMYPSVSSSNSTLLSSSLNQSSSSNNNNSNYYFPISQPISSCSTSLSPSPTSPFSLSPELLEEGERKSLTLELLPLVRADGVHDDVINERESVTGDRETTGQYINAFPYYKFL